MSTISRKLLPILTFVRIDVKRLFRDRVAIFFVFLFPLIFLVIFGSIFSNDSEISFRVGLLNRSDSTYAKNLEQQLRGSSIFKIDTDVSSESEAKEKMNRSQLDATIILPETYGTQNSSGVPSGSVTVLYDQSNVQAGRTLGSILESILQDNNDQIAPQTKPFVVQLESTATKGLTQFDYIFSGILGLTLISLGIFGPTTVFPRLKQRGVLRRYHTTSLKIWQYFLANVVSNAFVGLLALIFMMAVAFLFYDLQMRGSYLVLAAVVILSTIMLFGIGLALGGWAKNENQAAPLAQITALPMMFISGVFFPTFLMPELLQNIARFVPLTPVVDAIRLTITENASLAELAPQLGLITLWAVAIYIVAFKVFRWE